MCTKIMANLVNIPLKHVENFVINDGIFLSIFRQFHGARKRIFVDAVRITPKNDDDD